MTTHRVMIATCPGCREVLILCSADPEDAAALDETLAEVNQHRLNVEYREWDPAGHKPQLGTCACPKE